MPKQGLASPYKPECGPKESPLAAYVQAGMAELCEKPASAASQAWAKEKIAGR